MNYLPLDYFGFAAAFVYALCMGALCIYAVHSLWLLWRYRASVHKHDADAERENEQALPDELPDVLVQIPVFNERDVVERAMDAAAALDWPHDKLHIQVLDDSTDDCVERSRAHAESLRQGGLNVEVLHRTDRTGYKAGALEAGMQKNTAPFIAIFDADFIPKTDFLKLSIKALLNDGKLALVQGRWEHLNRDDNILCKAQAIGIDGHFAVEQGARAWSDLALNFNGTCGIWRRNAIIDAGGWEHDTLTEDMDLSYRAQLNGWRCTYRQALDVPGEIPDHVDAWRSQQFRWAKGSIQTALKLLPRVWRSSWSLTKKTAATLHMTHYFVHPLMLISLICAPIALGLCPEIPSSILMFGLLAFLVGVGSPVVLYAASQYILHGRNGLKRMRYFPALAAIGTGIAISNSRAVSQALSGKVSAFIRTPKKGDKGSGSYKAQREHGIFEIACALWAGLGIAWGLNSDRPWITPLLLIYVSGFAWVGILSLRSWWSQLGNENRKTPLLLYASGSILVLFYIGLAALTDNWIRQSLWYGLCGLGIMAVFLLSVFVARKSENISKRGIAFIVICGLAIRAAMLIGMPHSDDVNRYIVEGRQAAYAQNPYVYAPHDPETRALLDGRLDTQITDAVNHPTWTAIYPPLTIAIETVVTHIRSTPLSIKMSVFICEILSLMLLSGLLARRGLPMTLLVLAWWNPVGPIWLSGEGHNDAYMLVFVMLGIWLFDQASTKRGIVAISLAALCKPFAAWALLPSLVKSSWRIWIIPPVIASLAYLPFIDAGSGLFHSLGRFGSELHFHGALEPLLRLFWKSFSTDPQFVRFAILGSLMCILFFGSALLIWRDHKGIAYHGAGDHAALIAKLFALVFLCLPTMYPWYFGVLVFLLPMVQQSWGLIIWTACTPIFWFHGMAIDANDGNWTETYWVTTLAHLPALIWLLSDICVRSKPWRSIPDHGTVSSGVN